MRRAFLVNDVPDLVCKIDLSEMRAGDINGNRYALPAFVEPFSLVSGNMLEHVVVDLSNESAVLENRNELSGRYESHVLRDPSDKGFCAEMLVCTGIVLGLVIDFEFLLFESFLLVLSYKIDPLLILNELVVEECDA